MKGGFPRIRTRRSDLPIVCVTAVQILQKRVLLDWLDTEHLHALLHKAVFTHAILINTGFADPQISFQSGDSPLGKDLKRALHGMERRTIPEVDHGIPT